MRNRSEEQDEADIDEEVVSLNAGYVYWSEGHISRRRLDGQGSEQRIGEGWANAVDLFVDIDGGKIYWLNSKEYPSGGFIGLVRADLDGENPELLAEPDSAYMRNLVVDLDGNLCTGINMAMGMEVVSGARKFSRPAWTDRNEPSFTPSNL